MSIKFKGGSGNTCNGNANGNGGGSGDGFDSGLDSGNAKFIEVIKDMVVVGHASNQHAENVLLEVKGFKFAQNKEFSDCLRAVIPGLMEIVAKDVNPANDQVKLIQAVKQICTASPSCWGYKLVNGLTQSDADKLAVIEYIEDYCIQPGCEMSFYAIFRFIMQLFYDAGMCMLCIDYMCYLIINNCTIYTIFYILLIHNIYYTIYTLYNYTLYHYYRALIGRIDYDVD